MDVKNIVVAPYSVGLLFSTVFSLTPASNEPSGHARMHIWRLPRGKEAGQRIGIRKKRGRI